MINAFRRASVAFQAAALLVLTLSAMSAAFFIWAMENAIHSEVQHARTVADMADAFRKVAAEHGGFYLRRADSDDVEKIGRYLAKYETPADEDGRKFVFHQKNPFMAVADYSRAVHASPAEAKFKITSDNYMNPANSPDFFDMQSMQKMREDGTLERYALVDGQLRYVRALRAEKACLACHGSYQNAPPVVKANYPGPRTSSKGNGYGYELGEIVGVTSVSVPHYGPLQMLAKQSIWFWAAVIVVVLLIVMGYVMAVRGVVKPLRELTEYAELIAESESIDDLKRIEVPTFDRDERTSNNEIHVMSFASKALHESMMSAMDRIRRYRSRIRDLSGN